MGSTIKLVQPLFFQSLWESDSRKATNWGETGYFQRSPATCQVSDTGCHSGTACNGMWRLKSSDYEMMFSICVQILVFNEPRATNHEFEHVLSLCITKSCDLRSFCHRRLAACCSLDNTSVSACPSSKAEMSKWIRSFITMGRASRELQEHVSDLNTPAAPL